VPAHGFSPVVRQRADGYTLDHLSLEVRVQECARGVLLTPSGLVLLVRVIGRAGSIWITPGGRIRPGEDPTEAAIREVREETGLPSPLVGGHIWTRHGTYLADGVRLAERERYFLMPTEWFEPTNAGMEPDEMARHGGFRWWAISELAESSETFVPRRLPELVRNLQQSGPPLSPLESGE
jgi:8-oxo-dGTP pyrophosphatase MutT (NUDIX family)